MSRINLVLLLLMLLSCQEKNDVESSVIGKWKLVEVFADPGDGRGTFHSVTEMMTIEFFTNDTFESSENLCPSAMGNSTTGTFSLDDKTILPDNCATFGAKINFDLTFNNLIISFPCTETCLQKFVKIGD